MRDDELMPHDDRWALRLERRLRHPITKVWQSVTEPEHLAQWFPASVDLDLRPGGAMRFSFGPDVPSQDGKVLELDPPHLFAFTWDDSVLRFELTGDDDGTLLVFTHVFDEKPSAASYASGWDVCLAALTPVLAGEPVPAAQPEPAQHEALVKRFGLDQPTVTEADGRWTVRFERQLTCPADVAWDLFLGRDQQTGAQRTAPGVGEPLTPFAAPDVVLGTVTDVEHPRVLAFDTAAGEPGDHVRVELVDGTGHGARLVLTATGSSDRPDERDAAIDQWGAGAVEHVAAEAAALAETAAAN